MGVRLGSALGVPTEHAVVPDPRELFCQIDYYTNFHSKTFYLPHPRLYSDLTFFSISECNSFSNAIFSYDNHLPVN